MLLVLMVVIGIIANPNTVPQKIDGFEWLPINLYINGDTFYYILYGMLGRAIGMMDTQHKALSWVSAALFATGVFIISRGTLYELQWRGNFADTWYLYCGPMVFICAIALLTLVKKHAGYAYHSRTWLNLPPFIGYIRIPRLDYPCAAHPGN